MRVETPRGARYRVRRRWLPWKRRVTYRVCRAVRLPGFGNDPISAILRLVEVTWFTIAVAALLGELALLVLLFPWFLVARFAFGAAWVLEVRGPRRRLAHLEAVEGWDASQERMRALAAAVGRGEVPRTAQAGPLSRGRR